MADVRILSDYLTLILWISTVFIFNAVGWNILQSFQALKFSTWPWQVQRGQLTFLRAHHTSVAELGLESGYHNPWSRVLSTIRLCPHLFRESFSQAVEGQLCHLMAAPWPQQWTANPDWVWIWVLFSGKLKLRRPWFLLMWTLKWEFMRSKRERERAGERSYFDFWQLSSSWFLFLVGICLWFICNNHDIHII